MRRLFLAGALALLAGSSLALAAPAATIPSGTKLETTLDQTLSTNDVKPGDRFTATVAAPVVGADGQTLVPRGARVMGEVTNVQKPANGQSAAIKLDVKELEVNGVDHPLDAKVSDVNVGTSKSTSKTKRNAIIGGVGGAVLGGATHGWKGALIGGALGAGAGTVIGIETSGSEGRLSKGAALTLTTTSSTEVGGTSNPNP